MRDVLRVAGLSAVLVSAVTQAESWEPVFGAHNLRAVFSDTELEATLQNGEKMTARYRSDGTGEVSAWGDTFSREWKVDGNDLICIRMSGRYNCFRLEQNSDNENEYRATNVATRETVIFMVTAGVARAEGLKPTGAGGAGAPSAEEMAAKLSNPTAPIMTLGNNFDVVRFQGDLPDADEQTAVRYTFQSVFPYKLGGNRGNVFLRPAIPIFFNEPVPASPGDFDKKGVALGDIGFDLAWGKTNASGWLYGGGMVATLPTATADALGKDRWAVGPELLFGAIGKWGTLGGLLTHQWDFAGSGDANINVTGLNYWYAFPMGGGWQVAANPAIAYDHEQESGSRLTLPLGVGIAKTAIIKGRPWKFQLQYWNYVESNDLFAPKHLIRFAINPVVSAPWNEGR